MVNLTSKSKFTPFWACPRDNSSTVQARATKFGPEVLNTLVKILVVFGVDWAWHVKWLIFKILFICITFASLKYLWDLQKRVKRSLFHILNGYTHIFSPTGTCHGPWNSRVVSLVWPLLASQSSTRRLTMDYCMWSPGGEVGTFAFDTISPALLGTCNGVYERSRVGNQRMSLQKCANLSGCMDLLAHARTRLRALRPDAEYSCCYRWVAVKFIWDWNRIYLLKYPTI